MVTLCWVSQLRQSSKRKNSSCEQTKYWTQTNLSNGSIWNEKLNEENATTNYRYACSKCKSFPNQCPHST